MKTLVTVTRNGDAIRISKVTAHGEELIEPDVEAKLLAMLLWARLSKEDPGGGATFFPWHTITDRLDKLTQSTEKLSQQIEKHAHAMKEFQAKTTAPQPTPVRRGQ